MALVVIDDSIGDIGPMLPIPKQTLVTFLTVLLVHTIGPIKFQADKTAQYYVQIYFVISG